MKAENQTRAVPPAIPLFLKPLGAANELRQKKKYQVYQNVKAIKISDLQILLIIGKEISKKRFQFLQKHRLDVDNPAVGLICDFAKPTSINSKRQPPYYKEDHPDILLDESNHRRSPFFDFRKTTEEKTWSLSEEF